ncbi:hypothetical protein ACO0RG_000298 [Hanseniaspora osmophila]|uniref:Prokaryotic-type class I peptide chain release factors domain-containing protein n=1 Tax=Hanseniaspora osmophila TaxID=56408 RepID=A0A1E5R580_9ASCO|nr:hypothetical protein AWRI3579_g3770 [Hanseniaspora osmophila]
MRKSLFPVFFNICSKRCIGSSNWKCQTPTRQWDNFSQIRKQLCGAKPPALMLCRQMSGKIQSTNSEYTADDISKAQRWLSRLQPSSIPKHVYEQRFSRSSGPGGQNVNKLNTKCTLIFPNISKTGNCWIPNLVLNQLLHGNVKNEYKNFLLNNVYSEKKDALVIQSDRERSRELNKIDCLNKVVLLLQNSFFVQKEISQEDEQKWTNIKKSSNEHRLKKKKFLQDKKQSRKKIPLDY